STPPVRRRRRAARPSPGKTQRRSAAARRRTRPGYAGQGESDKTFGELRAGHAPCAHSHSRLLEPRGNLRSDAESRVSGSLNTHTYRQGKGAATTMREGGATNGSAAAIRGGGHACIGDSPRRQHPPLIVSKVASGHEDDRRGSVPTSVTQR